MKQYCGTAFFFTLLGQQLCHDKLMLDDNNKQTQIDNM